MGNTESCQPLFSTSDGLNQLLLAAAVASAHQDPSPAPQTQQLSRQHKEMMWIWQLRRDCGITGDIKKMPVTLVRKKSLMGFPQCHLESFHAWQGEAAGQCCSSVNQYWWKALHSCGCAGIVFMCNFFQNWRLDHGRVHRTGILNSVAFMEK